MPAVKIVENDKSLEKNAVNDDNYQKSMPLPWKHFVEQFGVKNIVPIAQPGENTITKLDSGVIGKVPSVYNKNDELVGYKSWQERRATAASIAKWSADPRYGFGVILGHELPAGGVAVCIDVDTEDEAHQDAVEHIIRHAMYRSDEPLPQRVRDNSNRRAYVLRVTGAPAPIKKRVLLLAPNARSGKQQAVEILAHGQQFVAAGRHPSGADIEWLDGPADSLTANYAMPVMNDGGQTVTVEQLAEIIAAIKLALPIESDTHASASKRAPGGVVNVEGDDVARYLDAEGWTLSIAVDGARRIRSPFEHEYTNEQGDNDSSVVYYSAGTGKNKETGEPFAQGHFVSLHASDAGRTDHDWLREIGYLASEFDILPAEVDAPPPAPNLQRDKAGRPLAMMKNLIAAMAAPQWFGSHVVFDAFQDRLVIGGPGEWRPFRDTDYAWLRVCLENHGFQTTGKELIRDAVHATAERFQIDTAQEWLAALEWDGVPRVESFFQRYFSVAPVEGGDSKAFYAYAAACSRYIWTALAGRILKPGVKADMMPILIGEQGTRKTSGVQAMVPSIDLFTELDFFKSDDDNSRKMRGKIIGEYGEMKGLSQKDINAIKAFVSRTHDEWIPKYQEHSVTVPRRCMFIGTSNDDELLNDPTGARRFLPMNCGAVDVPAIERDREQLWAEGRELFSKGGVDWLDAERMGREQTGAFRLTDPVEDLISEWLGKPEFVAVDGDDLSNDGNAPVTIPGNRPFITSAEVIQGVNNPALRMDQVGKMRVGKALLAMGYKKGRKNIDGRFANVYIKAS